MLGHIRKRIKGAHGGDLFDGVLFLIVFTGLLVQHTFGIEAKVFYHEGIHCLTLDVFITVFLFGEVGVLNLIQGSKIFVYGLRIGIFHLGCVFGPVAPTEINFMGRGAAIAAISALLVSNFEVL